MAIVIMVIWFWYSTKLLPAVTTIYFIDKSNASDRTARWHIQHHQRLVLGELNRKELADQLESRHHHRHFLQDGNVVNNIISFSLFEQQTMVASGWPSADMRTSTFFVNGANSTGYPTVTVA